MAVFKEILIKYAKNIVTRYLYVFLRTLHCVFGVGALQGECLQSELYRVTSLFVLQLCTKIATVKQRLKIHPKSG